MRTKSTKGRKILKNNQEKSSRKISNSTKWGIFVVLFLIVLIVAAVINIVNRMEQTKQTSIEPTEIVNNTNIQVIGKLENLEQVTDKTEEELQEINKKEIEEAEKKEQAKEEQKDNKTTSKPKPKNKYYIKVNYGAQVVNVYTYDKDGKYTVPVKAFVCSTGTETPRSGVYRIPAKITWCYMYGNVWGHYCSQIVGNILFHSVPYLERNNHTLEYWAYDQLGTKASMGCIRLTTRDAKWIYDNVSTGTSVEFYSSSNPGPLGKPTAQKISNAPGNLKWWDPTDPDVNNPWRNYKPSTNNNTTNSNSNNTTNNNTQKPSGNQNNVGNNNTTEKPPQNENTQNNTQNTNNTQTNNTQNNNQTNIENSEPPKNNNQNENQNNNQTNNIASNENADKNDMVNEQNKGGN